MRPTLLPRNSVNQRFPSGPAAMPIGQAGPAQLGHPGFWSHSGRISHVNSNETGVPPALLEGAVRPTGPPAPGIGYSVMTPEVVILPILSPLYSVNHRFPSAPAATKAGLLLAVGMGNSVITPAVVILAMPLEPNSVNHRLPSGPTVIP